MNSAAVHACMMRGLYLYASLRCIRHVLCVCVCKKFHQYIPRWSFYLRGTFPTPRATCDTCQKTSELIAPIRGPRAVVVIRYYYNVRTQRVAWDSHGAFSHEHRASSSSLGPVVVGPLSTSARSVIEDIWVNTR